MNRQLGFWMALALVMGNMIGSGVFLLPASLAPYGWNAPFGWLFTIAGALCLAYVIARLARALPDAGGPVGFIAMAFGPMTAFVVAWSYLISLWVGIAAISTAAVSYLSTFSPGITAGEGSPALLALGVIWTVTVVNLVGVRSAGGFQVLTMTLKLLPLLAVAVIAAVLFAGDAPVATPFVAEDISATGIGASAALTLWAMLGFESAALGQRRIANADVIVPRATILGALGAGIAYLSVSLAILSYLPAAEVAHSNAPFADFIAAYWGRGPSLFIALFAAISAIGAVNGFVLLQGEIPRAMAADGHLPMWFARTNARGTPVRSLVVSSVIVSLFTIMNSSRSMADLFTFLALLSTGATLILYFFCAAAALKLARDGRMKPQPLLLGIAVLGLIYALWTFHGAGIEATGWAIVLAAAGIPLYLFVRRQKAIVPAE